MRIRYMKVELFGDGTHGATAFTGAYLDASLTSAGTYFQRYGACPTIRAEVVFAGLEPLFFEQAFHPDELLSCPEEVMRHFTRALVEGLRERVGELPPDADDLGGLVAKHVQGHGPNQKTSREIIADLKDQAKEQSETINALRKTIFNMQKGGGS